MTPNSVLMLLEAGLTSEQMKAVMTVLAAELEQAGGAQSRIENKRKADRERVAKCRATVALQSHDNEATNVKEIPPTPPKENIYIPPIVPPKASGHPDFKTFFDAYPKRQGNADRKAAAKAFNTATKRATVEQIVSGAKAYSDWCKNTGKVGTEYVKQARSWLNADGWLENYGKYSPADSQATVESFQIIQGSPEWQAWERAKGRKLFATDLRDKHNRPIGQKGCYMPTRWPPGHEQVAA